jgi:phospholipid transport system substrate-binding protein
MSKLAALAVVAVTVCLPAWARASSPMASLKHSNEEVRQILKQQKGGAISPEQRARVKKIVNGFLDYEELARRSLAGQWDKMTKTQRTEFVQVFRDLIERNYVKQLKTNVDYDIEYKGEEQAGEEATVHSVVNAQRKGRKAEISIDYKLMQKTGRWAVYDVITDDVSLLRNYRSQFARIIERDGFAALLAKMKKKLAETSE